MNNLLYYSKMINYIFVKIVMSLERLIRVEAQGVQAQPKGDCNNWELGVSAVNARL